jgi:hypothetical protein
MHVRERGGFSKAEWILRDIASVDVSFHLSKRNIRQTEKWVS